MRWEKALLLFVLISLFSSVIVIAEGSTIVSSPIKNEISPSEQASFKLSIINHEDVTRRYSIYSLQSGQGWAVDPSPLKDRIIEVGPKETYTTTILAHPLEDFVPGIYNVIVTIESDSGERFTEPLKMYFRPDKPVVYLPSIKVDIDMDEKIDPTEPVSVKLFLENRNPLNLTSLRIKLQSDMAEFTKEMTVELPPLEKKSVEFTITPNNFQQPKEYFLFFVFENEGQTVKVMEKKIEIITLLPDFVTEANSEDVFLKRFITFKATNNGNVKNTQEIKLPVSFWQGLLTKSDGKIKTIDDQRYIVWEVELGSEESVMHQAVTNYRLLFYIFIGVILIGLFYWYVRSPVEIGKKATTTKDSEEGALSQIKLTLEVRNKSKKPLQNVVITDVVPAIVNVEQNLELGTLKPKEVKSTKHGTKVTWSLAELDGLEHRLITYKVKAKLNILGTFSLPRAEVHYSKGKKGKHRKAYSNVFRLST